MSEGKEQGRWWVVVRTDAPQPYSALNAGKGFGSVECIGPFSDRLTAAKVLESNATFCSHRIKWSTRECTDFAGYVVLTGTGGQDKAYFQGHCHRDDRPCNCLTGLERALETAQAAACVYARTSSYDPTAPLPAADKPHWRLAPAEHCRRMEVMLQEAARLAREAALDYEKGGAQ